MTSCIAHFPGDVTNEGHNLKLRNNILGRRLDKFNVTFDIFWSKAYHAMYIQFNIILK